RQLRLTALRANFIERNIRLLRRLCARNDSSRGLALGVAGAREELSELSALERHRTAAVLARLWFAAFCRGVSAFFCSFVGCDFLRVLALRIARAGHEPAELPPLD